MKYWKGNKTDILEEETGKILGERKKTILKKVYIVYYKSIKRIVKDVQNHERNYERSKNIWNKTKSKRIK